MEDDIGIVQNILAKHHNDNNPEDFIRDIEKTFFIKAFAIMNRQLTYEKLKIERYKLIYDLIQIDALVANESDMFMSDIIMNRLNLLLQNMFFERPYILKAYKIKDEKVSVVTVSNDRIISKDGLRNSIKDKYVKWEYDEDSPFNIYVELVDNYGNATMCDNLEHAKLLTPLVINALNNRHYKIKPLAYNIREEL